MPSGNTPDPSSAVASTHPGMPGSSSDCVPAPPLPYRDLRVKRLAAAAMLAGILCVTLAPPVWADPRSDAKAQVAFGIRVAQAGLWREARLRFERAVQIDPSYPAAWNDLAIAYEQSGEHHKARAAYERALALAPKDAFIQQNFELFKEIHDRMTKRPCARPPC